MVRFTLPRDIYHGSGCLKTLSGLEGKKAMLCVGGGSMERAGFLAKAKEHLESAGMVVEVFSGIESDPSVDIVMKGADRMMSFGPDWIVAMGGGSAIDAAKAMWVKYEYPDITFEDMRKVFALPKLRRKARFCAIPSTSGTATEVTAFSIITDYSNGVKYPIADYGIVPDIAIIDPDLTMTMPQKVVAHTGMDALTHAIEAYVSTESCAYTDALALGAMRIIKDNLVASYSDEGNADARARMHDAQCMAGMAFSNALLGIVHSMAHKTGAAFADLGAHIIHGAANAMYLPKVIRYNAKESSALARYCNIADFLELGGGSDNAKIVKLVDFIDKLNDSLRIPHCIKQYGKDSYPVQEGFISAQDFSARLHDIAINAVEDACTASNPRKIDARTMEKLLNACYYDRDVDF